jgi:hypothetical protein
MSRFVARLSLLLLLLFSGLAMSSQAFAQVAISVRFGPPLLPVYAQPVCPGAGYLWAPGYWAWDGQDYYWVPGTWVLAPQVGFFWTPPYWGWEGGFFLFHAGYWGPRIGFYGGINYGFGYFGSGFVGGRWENGQFFYNRTVNNVNVADIHNVYNENVTNVNTDNHVSYNGGQGGINANATPEDEAATNEAHVPPVAAQVQHEQAARSNPELKASMNHGKPPIAATAKPGDFKGQGVVPARQPGGTYNSPANRGGEMGNGLAGGNMENSGANSRRVTHPNDMPPLVHASPPNTGNAKKDQQYQQQQDKLMQKQNQERQKLQQQQDKEHQQQDQKHANDAQKQQLEQKHQQQTQKLQQQQQQEQQKMQKQQPPEHQEQQRP